MSKRYSLTVVKGLESGQTFRLGRLKAALGRHTGFNDVVLSDPYISSKHAQIIYESGRFFLEDLGSTNKTFINGVALVPGRPVPLSDGMEFMLGETRIRFNFSSKEKRSVSKKKRPSSISGQISQMVQKFDISKYTPYTPIILGVIIWAVVVIIFWMVTVALNR